MEALSVSAPLDDFVAKIEATDWAGCDARAFARAATVKLVTLSKTEQYRNDTGGEEARVTGRRGRPVASAQGSSRSDRRHPRRLSAVTA